MTAPQRLQIKLFTIQDGIDKDDLINQFHSWIQKDLVDEITIDVADYSHVPDGPGILLVTHEADYAFDWCDGPGIRYVRKKDLPETLPQAVLQSYKQVLKAAIRLESELGQATRFDPTIVEITLLDRRLYPNRPYADPDPVLPELIEIFTSLFEEEDATHKRASQDLRYPYSVRIRVPHALGLEAILRNVESVPFLLSPI